MMQLAKKGRTQWIVRQTAQGIVGALHPKDFTSEALAIYRWVCAHIRYTRDPYRVEMVRDPEAMLREIFALGKVGADCDEAGILIGALTMSIGIPVRMATVGFQPGPHQHTFAEVNLKGQWVVLDPVAGPRTRGMLGRVQNHSLFY